MLIVEVVVVVVVVLVVVMMMMMMKMMNMVMMIITTMMPMITINVWRSLCELRDKLNEQVCVFVRARSCARARARPCVCVHRLKFVVRVCDVETNGFCCD
jgi:hypothetical protein